jgi:phospho-N-acetylmuramoyl-pentapeptide-transferase
MTLLLGLALLLAPTAAAAAHLFARAMHNASLGQRIRDYGPRLHERKSGTPTMGGVVILLLWGLSLLVTYRFHPLPKEALFVFLSGLLFGGIGFLDDFLSLHHKRSLGLSPLQKVLLSTSLSVVLFFTFPYVARIPVQVPFSSLTLSLPTTLSFLLFWGVFLATTNSMNLTDGLDGLATGTTLLILCGYLLLFPSHAILPVILPLVGILVGFLWVNAYPAQLFLGDVGSFALGGVVAALALTSGTALILPLLAGLLVLEASSVILQVGYYRLTKRRIFKISPLHHHFEHAEGIDYPYLLPNVEWPEPKIVLRLWIVEGISVGLGLLAARL